VRFEVISEIRVTLVGGEKIFQLVFKPSGVRQDIFERDWLSEGCWYFEIEIFANIFTKGLASKKSFQL
jgi:hypothetical protein